MTQDFTDDEPTFLQEARAAMDTLVYPASTWTVLDVTCRAVKAMLMHLEAASAPPAAVETVRGNWRCQDQITHGPHRWQDNEGATWQCRGSNSEPASPECLHLWLFVGWMPDWERPGKVGLHHCQRAGCEAVLIGGNPYVPSTQKAGG